MTGLVQLLSHRLAAVAPRLILGVCVIWIARSLYADPMVYFRKSAKLMPDTPWVRLGLRGLACFCLWGGSFIVTTAIAVQILDLHNDALAVDLIVIATIAAWFLLPRRSDAEDRSNTEEQK